jgi:26S proteasome regulatory subunit N5
MIELDQHEGTYLNICRHYRAVYETPSIRDNPSEKLRILKHVVLFVVLR